MELLPPTPPAPPTPPSLPVKFDPPEVAEIPISIKPKEKKKYNRKLREAQVFAKFGIQPIRIKSAALAQLGHEAEKAGIKQIGYGRVIVASDNAEEAVEALTEIASRMLKDEKPDYDTVLEVMRLQKEFNGQVITTAQIHINAEKQVVADKPTGITVPYPSGAPVMIAVGKPDHQA